MFSDLFTALTPVLIGLVAAGTQWAITRINALKAGWTGYLAQTATIVIATVVGFVGQKSGWNVTGAEAFAVSFIAWIGVKAGVHSANA